MKNIHIYLLFIVFLFSFPITSADYTNSGTINNERKEKIQNFKKDFNKSRLEKKELISNNIEKIKENRSIISENSIKGILSNLNNEDKIKIKEIFTIYREEQKILINSLKTSDDKKTIKDNIYNLKIDLYESIIPLLADSSKDIIESRLDILKENNKILKENYEARMEFRGDLGEKIGVYKNAFEKKLGNNLEKVNSTKLEKTLTKIDLILEKIESNTRISQTEKDKINSQIIALKEILEEAIEKQSTQEIDLDIESIIK